MVAGERAAFKTFSLTHLKTQTHKLATLVWQVLLFFVSSRSKVNIVQVYTGLSFVAQPLQSGCLDSPEH